MKPAKPRVLMASSVHRWNDGRIYYKEAQSLAKLAEVHLVAVETLEKGRAANGQLAVSLLPARGLRNGERKSVVHRFDRIVRILGFVLRQKYDVFHFHDPELLPVGWFVKLRGKKVIYDMHEDVLHLPTRRKWIPRWLGPILGKMVRAFEKLSVVVFDQIILAESAYASVFPTKKSRCVLNYPKIEQTYKPVRRNEGESLKIVYVGALTRVRGTADLLAGVRELRQSGVNITLDLYGSVTETEIYRLISDSANEGWLTFHGWIPTDILLTEVRRYHVGVAPLREHAGYLHIRPTKVMEYVASGLAVVATSLPGLSEMLAEMECGVLFPSGDIEGLKNALLSLEDEDLRFSLAMKGHERINRYSWTTQEEILLGLYQEMFR